MNTPLIAFIDSGIGGLPYMDWVRRKRPNYSFLYVADTAHFPYGTRSEDDLLHTVENLTSRIISRYKPNFIVVACNTASVVALEHLRNKFKLPFVGVVPAIKPAAAESGNRSIIVLSTERTAEHDYLDRLISEHAQGVQVARFGLPGLVDFVEFRMLSSTQKERSDAVHKAVAGLDTGSADRMVLGCTHFLHLRSELSRAFPGIELVDSVEGVGRRIINLTDEFPDISDETIPSEHKRFGNEWGGRAVLKHTENCASNPRMEESGSDHSHRYKNIAKSFSIDYGGVMEGAAVEETEDIGRVVTGSKRIYKVRRGNGRDCLARIKGKVLADEVRSYNPLASGDLVKLQKENSTEHTEEQALILDRKPRETRLIRWNKKKKAPQVLAANAQQLMIVTSVDEPPFRPRFIDRLLVAAAWGQMKSAICINKSDLGMNSDIRERIEDFERLGFPVFSVSARTGEGIEELHGYLSNKTTVLIGQSGVGKSSLFNALFSSLDLRVGGISEKYNRGSHTTTFSHLYYPFEDSGAWCIDTPGIREFELYGVPSDELKWYFPDIVAHAGACRYNNCNHIDEPDCAVMEAVENGDMPPDRYESYLRTYIQLKDRESEIYE